MATKKTGSAGGSGGGAKAGKKVGAAGGSTREPNRTATRKGPVRPRLRSSYASAPSEKTPPPRRAAGGPAAGKAAPTRRAPRAAGTSVPRVRKPTSPPSSTKTPLAGPRRPGGRKSLAPISPNLEASRSARDVALVLAGVGMEKKAVGIEILDVASKVDYADILVIMTGRSDRHVYSIASGLEAAMRERGVPAVSVEGLTASTWVLLDFGDVVVHVFQEDTRRLYDIEGLWIDASRIPVPDDDAGSGADDGPVFD